MGMSFRVSHLLVAGLGIIASWAQDAVAQGTGAVAGRVVVAGSARPAVGAGLFVDGARSRVTTDPDGRFRITGIAVGRRSIEARLTGYDRASQSVVVTTGGTVTVELSLSRSAQELTALTVIGTPTDLEETKTALAAVPGGVDYIGPAEIRATRQANLRDVLGFTPGVFVQPRFGAADESQISIRGSGLRNNFHARGLNVLVNGMPYRNADGFTDFESLELTTVEAIEVSKGANAFRLGGSTLGGAINLTTKTGFTARPFAALAQAGAFGFVKAQVESGHQFGALDYYASYAHTGVDGYRRWSEQGRDRVNLHLGYRLGQRTDARAFYFFARVREQLPGALTAAEFASTPDAAVPENATNRWGRDYDLHHIGVQLRSQLGAGHRLEVSPYLQTRDMDHPIFEVLNQQAHDVGAEIRYLNTGTVGGRASRFTIGVQPAFQRMRNRQYVNVAGAHGALTRDERDRVANLAVYAEESIDLADRLTATAGIRYDRSRRTVRDDFLSNGDQSDVRTYEPVTPRLGLLYRTRGGIQVFANASKTVEPPLLLEMTSFGNPGGFIDLEAQRAWQFEVGARGERGGLGWELSFYDIELRDEILNLNVQPFPNAPFTIPTYRNAPKTRHLGLEAGLDYRLPGGIFSRGEAPDQLTIRGAYTFNRFTYVEDPTYQGNAIPGAPKHHVVAELRYAHPTGFRVTPSVEWVPTSYYLDSRNTVTNDSWASFGVRAEWLFATAGVTAFMEGRNLTDARYSASAQVDNGAGRFYEPADRRSLVAGIRWLP